MFQHNRTIKINVNSYEYVKAYKSEMLRNLAQLFSDIHVRYVISHGNLLEYERGQPIFQDDDLDIRVCKLDIEKWGAYCKEPTNQTNPKYNIRFDNRFHNMDRQKNNGIQCWLINFNFKDTTDALTKMNIHADIVFDSVPSKQWMDYDIDWEGIEEITYMDTITYVPKKEERNRLLKKNYGGRRYIIPHLNIKL